MGRKYRKFDEDFKQGAVQLVVETGKPIAQVARDLGINEGTLGNWCAQERRARKKDPSHGLRGLPHGRVGPFVSLRRHCGDCSNFGWGYPD